MTFLWTLLDAAVLTAFILTVLLWAGLAGGVV
jgi:hypothetical protein